LIRERQNEERERGGREGGRAALKVVFSPLETHNVEMELYSFE
jgi:hypothetical protein